MKNLLSNSCHQSFNAGISLQLLVNELIGSSLVDIVRNKCIVINEVPSTFKINTNKIVTPVIGELLNTMVSNANNGCIYISAERFKGIIILKMQERNTYNGYALAFSLKSIEPKAAMVGGNILVQGIQQLVTTVSFCFPQLD